MNWWIPDLPTKVHYNFMLRAKLVGSFLQINRVDEHHQVSSMLTAQFAPTVLLSADGLLSQATHGFQK